RRDQKTMKTLFILRHAKSSWSEPDLSDFERPLNERGLRAAPFMGELMGKNGFQPSVILSSPAVRAKQTAQLVKKSGNLDADIRFEHRIYEASPQSLRQVVSEIDDSYESAMLVGHNPGIEGFISFLTGSLEPMPTAALAMIELNVGKWNVIDDGCGESQNIFRPKNLTSS
ncbi:MAG: histidine phosphatase family protein, partial [Pyrinomonadaceae bacterium]